MSRDLPFPLQREPHVELHRRSRELVVRRLVLVLLLATVVAALLNVFGQRPVSSSAAGGGAKLTVSAPDALRGGLIYQVRFEIEAVRELEQPRLLLDPGWFEGMTLNSVQPDAVEWSQSGGRNVLGLGRIGAGDRFVLRLHFQVNPTSVGGRDQDVTLADGERVVAAVRRSSTVYP